MFKEKNGSSDSEIVDLFLKILGIPTHKVT